jgi:hypothetical protein
MNELGFTNVLSAEARPHRLKDFRGRTEFERAKISPGRGVAINSPALQRWEK